MFKRVLLCYDGSAAGRAALRNGANLAAFMQAEVDVLCILSKTISDAALSAAALGQVCVIDFELEFQRSLHESISWLEERGVKAHGHFAKGDTLDEIVAHCARLSSDLVVVGHYPQPSGGRWWSPSGRTSLAERVKCCVLIAVPEASSPAAQAPLVSKQMLG